MQRKRGLTFSNNLSQTTTENSSSCLDSRLVVSRIATNQVSIRTTSYQGAPPSQYPTAMRYMRVPVGRSSWADAYDDRRHGFYEIKNLVWNPDVVKRFKIVCGTNENKTRDWNNLSKTTLMDSYMIKYQMEHCR